MSAAKETAILYAAPSRESRTDECAINPVMSCVCKRGTKSCVIAHADPSSTDRQAQRLEQWREEREAKIHQSLLDNYKAKDRQEPGLSAEDGVGINFSKAQEAIAAIAGAKHD